MKSIVYIRTSTKEQDPKQQLRDIIAMIPEGEEYTIIEEQASAFKNKHVKFTKEILPLISSGKLKKLYAWDSDRLYRKRLHWIQFVKLAYSKGCKVILYNYDIVQFMNQQNTDGPIGQTIQDLMIGLVGAFAEAEAIKLSKRVKKAVRKEKGVTVSFKGNKWGRKQVPTITRRKVYRAYQEGKSIPWIMEHITTSKNGNIKTLGKSTIYKIIRRAKEEEGAMQPEH